MLWETEKSETNLVNFQVVVDPVFEKVECLGVFLGAKVGELL